MIDPIKIYLLYLPLVVTAQIMYMNRTFNQQKMCSKNNKQCIFLVETKTAVNELPSTCNYFNQ